MQISNNNIIITGGCGDIGRYLTDYLLNLENKVFIIDINDNSFSSIESKSIKCFKCDLTDYNDVDSTFERIFSSADANILVNCAGSIYSSPLINFLSKENKRHSSTDWDKIIKSNLYSTFYSSLCMADKMTVKRIKGLIVNFSSIASSGNLGQSAYSAAKAGIEALTKVWSKELSMFGIRTTCISPGFINTESTAKALSQANLEKIKSNIPSKRLGELEEIAKAIRFIIENDYFNGKVLNLDGGVVI